MRWSKFHYYGFMLCILNFAKKKCARSLESRNKKCLNENLWSFFVWSMPQNASCRTRDDFIKMDVNASTEKFYVWIEGILKFFLRF